MSTAKIESKKIRRAVQKQADAIRERVAVDIVANLCALPFGQRVKWAWKILRGLKLPWRVKLSMIVHDKISWWQRLRQRKGK